LANFKSNCGLDVAMAARSEHNSLSPTVRYQLSFSRILNISFGVTGVSFYHGNYNCVPDEARMKNQAQFVVIGGGVIDDEPISIDGAVFDWVTSGRIAHAYKTSDALATVPKEFALCDDGWTVELLGQSQKSGLINELLFDANASQMQS
tara:strand:- start:36 stop:482 length:447 start_codon:yes stop_codon:yes gene_type:complete